VLQLLTPTNKIPRERAALAAQQMRGDYPKAENANGEEIPSSKKLCLWPLSAGTWKFEHWQRSEQHRTSRSGYGKLLFFKLTQSVPKCSLET